ncbi:FliC/FljB family flagellin [Citrobacter braakii]|jgi:flagellin|uniref:FliC/FljB family flagellin n=1 Tax=Citrobacter TaxID=544 RepID=UPI0015E9F2E7|nr:MULTISPECIES: FliC/FljB family flagellin [Citrobacter]MBA8057956.1 FliC/FljB family flagellin [Citrobacter sp. RHBSTW-00104]MBY5200483.1 FliC/FljB family flagellin [Citrobacter braakii]MDM3325210.1 FliC/FljB family flagellin [Citrobacter sp. Cb080]QLR62446.1 FliC/FljB family flagellin [Citrobacter sp. RHBSTW-00976]QLW54926.1 FliC/FljB family flagellin [Citrobacter sp. RHBSTW-00628]
MAQVINTNSLSLLTQNNLNKSQSALGSAIERLSSGLRINSAKDDAAGQAIANRFTANIKGLTQASRNANDGISVAQTTEGALSEINNNLQRVRELSVQAANGSNSDSDLSSIQDEINQRLAEINRVSEQTDFNGKKVLNQDGQLTIQVGAKDNETITIDLKKIDSTTLGLADLNISRTGKTVNNGDTINIRSTLAQADFSDVNTGAGKVDFAGATAGDVKLAQDKSGKYYATADNGTTYYAATVDNKTGKVSIDSRNPASSTTGLTLTTVTEVGKDVTADTTALTAANKSLVTYKDQSGNAAYAVKSVDGNGVESYKDASITAAGVVTEGTNVLSLGTTDPLKKIDKALSDVDQFRSSLGAIQNRFESAITNLGNTVNNLSSARSRIEDSDYATEVSNMSRAQILQQAGTSVLAQANQTTQNVLSLLR